MLHSFIQLVVLEALGDLTLAVTPVYIILYALVLITKYSLPKGEFSHHVVKELLSKEGPVTLKFFLHSFVKSTKKIRVSGLKDHLRFCPL